MARPLSKLLAVLFMVVSQYAYGQHELFYEIVLEKTLLENEEWEFTGEANWKHLNDEPGWSRWGASFAGVRKIRRLGLSAGANGYYTFNREITNFFEIRPWMALQLKIPVAAEIALRQRLKYEWRFFNTVGEQTTRENYGRLRYQIGLDIPIPGGEESSWEVRPFFEWFFIRNPATFERFSNERDYGVLVTKTLKNEHELSFCYRMEEFYNQDEEQGNGHILLVGYSF